MNLFRRRIRKVRSVPTLPSAGRADDDLVLGLIAAESDIDTARHWMHYLYLPDEERARSVAQVIEAAGWDIRRVAAAAGSAPDWVVIAEVQAATTPKVVQEARLFLEDVADTHGGFYDGWEARL